MKRYDAELGGFGDLKIIERTNGDWVKWDDVQELIETLKDARIVIDCSINDGECDEYRGYLVTLRKIDKVLNKIEGTK